MVYGAVRATMSIAHNPFAALAIEERLDAGIDQHIEQGASAAPRVQAWCVRP